MSSREPLLIRCRLGLGLLLGLAGVLGVSGAEQAYAPDRILLQPKPGLGRGTLAGFHTSQNRTVVRSFEGLGGLQVVSLAKGETVAGAVAKYRQSGMVSFAEPDYFVHATLTPNDPKFTDGTLVQLKLIEAPAAWNVRTEATNIVVAVLDTGVNYTHEDLAANMWVNPRDGSHGWNALTGTNTPLDDQGHGSLVAGILGALGNNSKGVVGVAWKVQIMACKCLNNASPTPQGTISDAITCMEFARTNGAKIINASWGAYTNSAALSNAVYTARSAGVIVVAAAGNDIANVDVAPFYPAAYALDNVVSVGYTDNNDALGHYSNYGSTNVTLFAPGYSIYSTFFAGTSSYLGGVFLEGTSFAAPYVSGALALMLVEYPQEDYRHVIGRVLNTVDAVPAAAGKCVANGRLNLRKALTPVLLTQTAYTHGQFQLHVSGTTNLNCVLQASSDLGAWAPVYTNSTGTSGGFDYTNAQAGSALRQFYRVLAGP